MVDNLRIGDFRDEHRLTPEMGVSICDMCSTIFRIHSNKIIIYHFDKS